MYAPEARPLGTSRLVSSEVCHDQLEHTEAHISSRADTRSCRPSLGKQGGKLPFPVCTPLRLTLIVTATQVGERYVIFIYVLLAIALEVIVWFVPSLIGGAVAVAFVGVFLGPIYPIVMNHSGRILPPWLLTGCIGWIAGFGQAGSAFLPFLTGLLASREGIKTLQPL